MFAIETVTPTAGKMEARKELRMHRADEERIRAAAAATGLQEADFIRQAALLRVQEIEQRVSLSVLPVEAFDAFKDAVEASGKVVPGLQKAAEASKGCCHINSPSLHDGMPFVDQATFAAIFHAANASNR